MKTQKMGTELFAEIRDPGSEDTFQARLQRLCCHLWVMACRGRLGASCSKMLPLGPGKPGKHTSMAGHRQRQTFHCLAACCCQALYPAAVRPCTLHTQPLQPLWAGGRMFCPAVPLQADTCGEQQQLPPRNAPEQQ